MNVFTDMNPLLASSLQTSLAVAVLFALVLMVRKPFARSFGAKAAYALWLVPLGRLFMPPMPASFSLFGALAPTEAQDTSVAPVPNMVFVRAGNADVAAIPHPPTAAPAVEWAAAATPVEPGLFENLLAVLPHLVVPVWLTGIALMLGISWRRQSVFHRLIADDSALASEAVSRTAHEIAAQLKIRRSFEVRTSLLNGSPLVTGLLRPVVLLPEWFEDDYTPREQRDALTHELMHVKRGDLFALQAAQIVLALQWFNPLAYFSIRAFRVDQEAACDADVLRAGTSSAFSYGRTLVKAARLAGPADRAFSGANLTLAHPIKERLILMQNSAPTLRRRLLGSTLAVTLGSAAIFTTASCAASAAPKDQPATELAGGDETGKRIEREHARIYRFSSHHDDDGHQFVLLSDPFEELQPRLEELHKLDFSDLEEEMRVLSIEMENIGDLSALKDLEALEGLEGLAELGNLKFDFDFDLSGLEGFDVQTIETEDGIKIIIPNQEIFISRHDGDKVSIQIEKANAIAEAHAERAAAIAEVHAERAEKMAFIIETRMEEKADLMEQRAEEIEARIEAAFEGGLEEDLDNAGEIVENLAEQCEERDASLTSPVIISVRGDNGKTYRGLCVTGDRSRLDDEDVRDFVEKHPALSDKEKSRFDSKRTVEYEFSWTED